MNPSSLIRIKELAGRFSQNHPRMIKFFQDVEPELAEGSAIEIKVTDTNGNSKVANIRVTQEDLELLRCIRQMKG